MYGHIWYMHELLEVDSLKSKSGWCFWKSQSEVGAHMVKLNHNLTKIPVVKMEGGKEVPIFHEEGNII